MNHCFRTLMLLGICILTPRSPLYPQGPSPTKSACSADTLCVRFAPSSKSWLEIQDSAGIIQHAFTFECWIRLRSDGIIASRDAFVDTTSDWQLMYDNARERIVLITHYRTIDQYYYSPDNVLPRARWSHLALMVNGPDGFVHLFINGSKVWDLRLAPRHFDARTGFAIAGYYNNQKGAYIDCDMTEIRYWSGERSDAQIGQYWRTRVPLAARKNLVGYWRCTNHFMDSSGCNNRLRLRGSISFLPAAGLLEDPPYADLPFVEPLRPDEELRQGTARVSR